MVHIYNGILFSHIKEWNWVICRDVDGPRDFYTEWIKSKKEKYHILMYRCGIRKNFHRWFIYKAEIVTQM